MDLKKSENGKNMTPSTSAKFLVEKVMNSNSNCDNSPFRLLPNFSTPPSRFLKIKNPFDSPLVDRLHLPICSPGLFAKSTPNKEDKFKWSICDISKLQPAEIEITHIEQHSHTPNPFVESQIQEKISSFFSEQSVVPSPLHVDIKERTSCRSLDSTPKKLNDNSINNVSTQTRISLGPKIPKHVEEMLKYYENSDDPECETEGTDNLDGQYLPEDLYYKKLFDSEPESPQSSPPMSTGGSPLQFSPLKELEICSESSFSEHLDKKGLNECALSPITPEVGTPQKDRTGYMSVRESRSACRLVFTEKMSFNRSDNVVPDMLDQVSCHGQSFEDTVRTSPKISDSSTENWEMEYKHVSLASQDYEDCRMDISLPHTPNTGIFTTQRKRLSDSFKDLHDLIGNTEGVNFINHDIGTTRSVFSSEGSSDMGYYSGSGTGAPVLVENTWNNSHLIASTPTKKKK